MKHLKNVSKAPRCAQGLSTGSLLTLLGQVLGVLAQFLTSKTTTTA